MATFARELRASPMATCSLPARAEVQINEHMTFDERPDQQRHLGG